MCTIPHWVEKTPPHYNNVQKKNIYIHTCIYKHVRIYTYIPLEHIYIIYIKQEGKRNESKTYLETTLL